MGIDVLHRSVLILLTFPLCLNSLPESLFAMSIGNIVYWRLSLLPHHWNNSLINWNCRNLEAKSLIINFHKKNVIASEKCLNKILNCGKCPCGVCRKHLATNSVIFVGCAYWIYKAKIHQKFLILLKYFIGNGSSQVKVIKKLHYLLLLM